MFTSVQLAAEINTDPKNLGYAGLVTAKDRAGLVAKINSTYSGVTAVYRTDVTAGEIVACLVAGEVSTWTVTQWSALQTLLIPLTIDASKVTIRNLFGALLSGTSLINANNVAKVAVPTRAEELWGYGTRISDQDIANAIG